MILKHEIDTIITNIGQLLTMTNAQLGILNDVAIAINDGVIIAIGKQIIDKYRSNNIIDAKGMVVSPGLVDCHTHLVFAGTREQEMVDRLNGRSYLEILNSGGGINATVDAVHKVGYNKILQTSKKWLNILLEHGVTTVEIKSGYGLDYDNELKLLNIIHELKSHTEQQIISTFLAHAFPIEYGGDRQQEYMLILAEKMLPNFKSLAEFFDIFIEKEVFSAEQADHLLGIASKLGYKIKMHVNQINSIGGLDLAAKYKAISVDHIDNITEAEIEQLASTNAVAVLLPGASYFLNSNALPLVDKLNEYKIPIAIASNFNPGSCPSPNMQLMMSLAQQRFAMKPESIWQAVTINAARALGLEKEIGTIELGKKAHLVIWNMENYLMPFYFFGHNLVDRIILR